MCVICLALDKEQLTRQEADSAFREMILVETEDREHYVDARMDNLDKIIEEAIKRAQ